MATQDRILIMTSAFHFGDNPGLFHGHAFVGHSVSIPLRATWIGGDATFVFRTHDVETWDQAWQGHPVEVVSADLRKGHPLGVIKDAGDQTPEGLETTELTIPKAKFEEIVGASKNFYLRITLGVQTAQPGMADDFGLVRLECVNAALRVGWAR